MRIPKSLVNYVKSRGFQLASTTYKFRNVNSKGWAVVDKDKNELIELEPMRYTANKLKWRVVIKGQADGLFYAKNIAIALRKIAEKYDLKAGHTGWRFSGQTLAI